MVQLKKQIKAAEQQVNQLELAIVKVKAGNSPQISLTEPQPIKRSEYTALKNQSEQQAKQIPVLLAQSKSFIDEEIKKYIQWPNAELSNALNNLQHSIHALTKLEKELNQKQGNTEQTALISMLSEHITLLNQCSLNEGINKHNQPYQKALTNQKTITDSLGYKLASTEHSNAVIKQVTEFISNVQQLNAAVQQSIQNLTIEQQKMQATADYWQQQWKNKAVSYTGKLFFVVLLGMASVGAIAYWSPFSSKEPKSLKLIRKTPQEVKIPLVNELTKGDYSMKIPDSSCNYNKYKSQANSSKGRNGIVYFICRAKKAGSFAFSLYSPRKHVIKTGGVIVEPLIHPFDVTSTPKNTEITLVSSLDKNLTFKKGSDVPEGKYQLNATAKGYHNKTQTIDWQGQSVKAINLKKIEYIKNISKVTIELRAPQQKELSAHDNRIEIKQKLPESFKYSGSEGWQVATENYPLLDFMICNTSEAAKQWGYKDVYNEVFCVVNITGDASQQAYVLYRGQYQKHDKPVGTTMTVVNNGAIRTNIDKWLRTEGLIMDKRRHMFNLFFNQKRYRLAQPVDIKVATHLDSIIKINSVISKKEGVKEKLEIAFDTFKMQLRGVTTNASVLSTAYENFQKLEVSFKYSGSEGLQTATENFPFLNFMICTTSEAAKQWGYRDTYNEVFCVVRITGDASQQAYVLYRGQYQKHDKPVGTTMTVVNNGAIRTNIDKWLRTEGLAKDKRRHMFNLLNSLYLKKLFANKLIISDRYIDNKDGTVTDIKTNLQWLRCAVGEKWDGKTCIGKPKKMPVMEALAYSSEASYTNHDDWRIPNYLELSSLVKCNEHWLYDASYEATGCALFLMDRDGSELPYSFYRKNLEVPTIDVLAFPNTGHKAFWSSEYSQEGDSIFGGTGHIVGFNDGGNYLINYNDKLRARLVRGPELTCLPKWCSNK